MTRYRSISSVALIVSLAWGAEAQEELAEPAELSQEATHLCTLNLTSVTTLLSEGDVTAAQFALTALVPRLAGLSSTDDTEACRAAVDELIERAKAKRFDANDDAGVFVLSETAKKALEAARDLFRRGELVPMGNVLASARAAEPEVANLPQYRALEQDLEASREALALFESERYDAALRALSTIVVADPLNPWVRTILGEAKTRFVAAFPERVVQADPSLSAALFLAPRELSARDQIRDAWLELTSIPFADEEPSVVAVRSEIQARAEAKARDAIGHIMEGDREAWIPRLEDASAALEERAAIHLYLALAYYGRYLEGRETDPLLLEQVRSAIATALSKDPNVVPPRNFFTPRLLDLLEQVRVAGRP